MISYAQRPSSAPAISAISGARLSCSLRTGTTMETATVAVSGEDKSTLWVGWTAGSRGGPARGLLWTRRASGNPFEALQGGARQRHNAAVALDGKAEAARREPVAHDHGPEHADQAARHHVARVMRQQHQPRCADDERVDKHHEPRLRPQRGNRKRQCERRVGVAGRKTGKSFTAGEVREVEGIGLAADERPAPPDDPFDDFADENRREHSEEQKLQARAEPQ